MIGFDFPLRPSWIHDVHLLWEPELPVSELIARALIQTMRELGGEKTRRNTLSNLIHYFVRTEGGGSQRRTVRQDALVAYSRLHPVGVMAPVYLARLIALNTVASTITEFVRRRYAVGDEFTSTTIRTHTANQLGQRKVVTNAATSYLRTLVEFGVFEAVGKAKNYRFAARLPFDPVVFPLCVLTWLDAYGTPQIELEAFGNSPMFCFINVESFAAYWQKYDGVLWSLSARLGVERATLKYSDQDSFESILVHTA
jgi:hypothetical protein